MAKTPSLRESQKVQRTPRGGELVLANLQITLGALKGVMTQKSLNGHKIHSSF